MVIAMNSPGKEIKRVFDEHGIIQVFDDGNKRTLMFGQQDEQGCILKQSPELVQYDYIRAMLLVLLFKKSPVQVLVLGLGSGALVQSLFANTNTDITVVELRNEVIKIAQSHFELPRDKRLTIINDDAGKFIQQAPEAGSDIVFSDIYSSEGMDEQQGFDNYIDDCINQLSDDGWLVLNYWLDHKHSPVVDHIEYRFSQVWVNSIDGENWIVMATNSSDSLSELECLEVSRELAEKLGFSFSKSIKNLRRYI